MQATKEKKRREETCREKRRQREEADSRDNRGGKMGLHDGEGLCRDNARYDDRRRGRATHKQFEKECGTVYHGFRRCDTHKTSGQGRYTTV